MRDLINLGKKVAIAGGKEAMKYFRKPNLDFDNKSLDFNAFCKVKFFKFLSGKAP